MAYAQTKNTALDLLTIENRREERFAADGTVCLVLDHDGTEAVYGRLVDVSESGFRVAHKSGELTRGRTLRFHFEDRNSGQLRSGWARVIWSRILESTIESGCYIVISD
jgi:PilZ domain